MGRLRDEVHIDDTSISLDAASGEPVDTIVDQQDRFPHGQQLPRRRGWTVGPLVARLLVVPNPGKGCPGRRAITVRDPGRHYHLRSDRR